MVEFWTSDDGGEIMLRDERGISLLQKSDPLIMDLYHIIKEYYPHAYSALVNQYAKCTDSKCRIVSRFIRCNFSRQDSIPDVDGHNLNLEIVRCPMRSECQFENIICRPEFSTTLTSRETEILKHIAAGTEESRIADIMYLSVYTVKNHRHNIYRKLGIQSKAEAIIYCNKNKII